MPKASIPRDSVEYDEATRWQQYGACRDTDPNLFYPDPDDYQRETAAKSICAQCSVTNACLDFALATGQRDGIWGGTTEKERRRILRVRRTERRNAKQPN